jgi:cell filamentation protein
MPNEYRYIDPDYTYADPQTGILRNLAGVTDREALVFAETAATAKRAGELRDSPVKITDSSALFAIHRYLFQDLYEWAGRRRTVEITKGGKQFFPLSHFETALTYIDRLVAEYKTIAESDKKKLSHKLAEILDAVNFLHPFREGNGRTQREFVRTLALEKGWRLNLNPPDDIAVYERYMSGTINGDVASLAELIETHMTN